MAPRSQKRSSIVAGGIVKKQCTEVVKALAEADLPHPVLEMLKLVAPLALSTYADERHPHQVSLVGMIDEALKGVQASQQQKVEDCQAFVSSKDSEKAKREEAILETGKQLMESKIAVASKEYQVYEATQTYARAAAALKITNKEQKVASVAYAKLEENKADLENIKTRILEAKNTTYSPKCCQALERDLRSYDLDTSLVESLHLVLTKNPAERSEFDGAIMCKVDAALTAATANLDSKLVEEEPAKKARDEAAAAAQAANDSAKEKLMALQVELEAATGKVAESKKDVSAAEERLNKYPSDMVEADSVLADAQDQLAALVTTLDMFKALKDRTLPPPPPVEPIAAEAQTETLAPVAIAELEC